jgi:hypothetical protein
VPRLLKKMRSDTPQSTALFNYIVFWGGRFDLNQRNKV